MALTSDLVRDSKLRTTIGSGITRHVIELAGSNARQRKIRYEQHWKRTENLGEGAYGSVWLEKLVGGNFRMEERAVKIIKKRVQKSQVIDYSRELEAIAKFSHPRYNACFVESFGWFEDERFVFITMEYFPLGNLEDRLSDTAPLPETEVQQIAFQILEGLSHMHENGFAHRDLKPSNVLVRSHGPNWWVKIGDFGISKRAEDGSTALRTFSGTPGFLAPEVLVQGGLLECEALSGLREYTVAVDIWSLGEIVFRALTNEPPFRTTLASYIRGTAPFPMRVLAFYGVSEEGCDLVKSLLEPMPSSRITAGEALDHPWVGSQGQTSPRLSKEMDRSQAALYAPGGSTLETTQLAEHDSPTTMASAAWSTIHGSSTSDREGHPQPITVVGPSQPRQLYSPIGISSRSGSVSGYITSQQCDTPVNFPANSGYRTTAPSPSTIPKDGSLTPSQEDGSDHSSAIWSVLPLGRERVSEEALGHRTEDWVETQDKSLQDQMTISLRDTGYTRMPPRFPDRERAAQPRGGPIKTVWRKGFLQVSAFSTKSLFMTLGELRRTLDLMHDVDYDRIDEGYQCLCRNTRFDILIVKAPLVRLYGVKFEMVAGDTADYNRIRGSILEKLESLWIRVDRR
ncbi:kinase-like protein [Decorospora gaudefroyi]|uniref:non-specific serine/threonine protein kinase n=1 Tax=Decorospora gaudefroyi TaxID=184978 RepID=A0A6A5KW42_9PLEO|nr:kinase-like protein [Decorospora gaudefroyi]